MAESLLWSVSNLEFSSPDALRYHCYRGDSKTMWSVDSSLSCILDFSEGRFSNLCFPSSLLQYTVPDITCRAEFIALWYFGFCQRTWHRHRFDKKIFIANTGQQWLPGISDMTAVHCSLIFAAIKIPMLDFHGPFNKCYVVVLKATAQFVNLNIFGRHLPHVSSPLFSKVEHYVKLDCLQ